MQNLDHPNNSDIIEKRSTVPSGFKPFDDSQQRKFGMSLEDLARRCCPGAFIQVNGQVYFSRGHAESMSCR